MCILADGAFLKSFSRFCYFPMWHPGSGVVLDCIIPDLCRLSYIYYGRNVVTTLVPLFFDGSSSFFEVTRPSIKA